ncbi:hypothetical protein [Reichenbachiella versicolor]|uniref:hypothetical protein n=1 Tax=Reichenbachiella versicolor TaxID=1821036 RepID=UPI000D6DE0EC|nr:hypothetical protein [Reichenbachiella versicolor]
MQKDYHKDYNEFSNEFRRSDASRDSVEKLYDLLYELQEIDKTQSESLILSNIYSLLGFHQSAYDVFAATADLSIRKNKAKFQVMKDKASSHKDTFVIKDIRKLKEKLIPIEVSIEDFILSSQSSNSFKLIEKEVIIFNKKLGHQRLEIQTPNDKLEKHFDAVLTQLRWLADCKEDLIRYYNSHLSEQVQGKADEDWYYTLEVYRVKITVGDGGNVYSDITCADINEDHILDIETDGETIYSMSFDG